MAKLGSGQRAVMGALRTAIGMKPTFQEFAALLITLWLLSIVGYLYMVGRPVAPELLVMLSAAFSYTFGVRSGRAEQQSKDASSQEATTSKDS